MEQWASILIQIPLVAGFIFYSIKITEVFQLSMSKRDEAYLSALEKISARIDVHESSTAERITKMAVERDRLTRGDG